MAKKEAVTVRQKFACDKEVNCQCCGAVYRFVYKTDVDGTGPNERLARGDGVDKAPEELESEPGSEPCPSCGALQTCMEASSSAFGHGCAMWFVGILFAIALVTGILLNQRIIAGISPQMLNWILLVILLPGVAINVWLVRRNSNADLASGLADAKKKIDDGEMTIVSGSTLDPLPTTIPRRTSLVQSLLIGLSIVGLCLLPLSEFARMTQGWHLNKSSFPPVAGPGDDVTLYWPETLSCLKSRWNGTAEVAFTDVEGTLPKTPLKAECSKESWGSVMGGKANHNSDTVIWTKITVPDDPALAGKTIRLPAEISVKYPHKAGLFKFEERAAHFDHEFELHLSTHKAGAQFHSLWWIGLIAGGGLVVVSSYLLRRGQLSQMKAARWPKTLNVRNLSEAADN